MMDNVSAEYDARVTQFTPEVMPLVERFVYVNALDRLWIEHLEAMDSLRNGIGLRAIGQRDPLVEYKREGFRMFKQLVGLIEAEVATTMFKVAIQRHDDHIHAAAESVEVPQGLGLVDTALTRAAAEARSNASTEAAPAGDGGSRSQRRAKPDIARVNPKKRKKRR